MAGHSTGRASASRCQGHSAQGRPLPPLRAGPGRGGQGPHLVGLEERASGPARRVGVAQRADAGAHEPLAPDGRRPRTCAGPGGCAPRGSRCAGRPGPSTPTLAGAVMPSSSSTPWRRARSAPGAGVPPSTSATYSFSTPCDGWVRSWASAPSLVRISRPSVWRSRRPDREHPRLGGHERHDGGPALGVVGGGDDAVGLVQQVVDEVGRHRHERRRRPRPGPCARSTRRPSVRHLAVDRTRPAAISSSQARREPRPARARTFWSRSPSGARQAVVGSRSPRSDPEARAPTAGRARVRRRPRARAGSPRPAGSWSSESSPSRSRKRSVVPKSAGWPGPRRGPPPRCSRAARAAGVTPSTLTPRSAEICPRDTGWR